MITPHPYQVPAIRKTQTSLSEVGRALVVMATGLGKTIVGALSIQDLLKIGRGLFLCHLNSGLEQALRQFREVLGEETRLGVFHGERKHWDEVDILFASFQTFTNWKHAFFEDEFRFVIVDESHHGQAPTFKKVIEYFKPKELLALTATPDRMDQKDIREIFGHEIVNVTLEEGIAKGWLAQVEYHLVTDNMNRRKLTKIARNVLKHGKKISVKQLNETIFIEARDEKVAEVILGYGKKKTIVFCENVRHADNFHKYLPESKVYHSKIDMAENRATLEAFRRGECQRILVVDKMNECIDIPDAELIVFLRCTDSKTVFLQQLGRGLRKTVDKRKVVVLDFVANADRVMMVREMVDRVKFFTPDWTELETDPHFVKGNAFDFIFTDDQISLLKVLERLRPCTIAEIPELLAEYSERNTLPAEKVTACTRHKIWWKCTKCGHEVLQSGQYRRQTLLEGRKRKCPGCIGDRSLLGKSPRVAAEYSSRNKTPIDKVSANTTKRFWWECSRCGHEWQAAPHDRTARFFTGCPACGRSRVKGPRQRNILTEYPLVAKEYSERNTMPITHVAPFSGQKYWWKCSSCTHEWEARCGNRTRHGHGCPKCRGSNKLPKAPPTTVKAPRYFYRLSSRPELARQYSSRNQVPLSEVFLGSHRRCWWECGHCGHEWETAPANRNKSSGKCPKCRK